MQRTNTMNLSQRFRTKQPGGQLLVVALTAPITDAVSPMLSQRPAFESGQKGHGWFPSNNENSVAREASDVGVIVTSHKKGDVDIVLSVGASSAGEVQ